jgi:hypothetical protein
MAELILCLHEIFEVCWLTDINGMIQIYFLTNLKFTLS